MRRLLIATTNRGKVKELVALLEGLDIEVVGLESLGTKLPQVEETGETLVENAWLKAREYHRIAGCLTLADDSGLEVESLGGRPGVNSARYGGEGLSDAERNQKLLEEMQGVAPEARGARFVCVLALIGEGIAESFCGVSAGYIAGEATGEGGFGYDPVFIDVETGRSYAELTVEEKARRSHRGRAMLLLRKYLSSVLPGAVESGRETLQAP